MYIYIRKFHWAVPYDFILCCFGLKFPVPDPKLHFPFPFFEFLISHFAIPSSKLLVLISHLPPVISTFQSPISHFWFQILSFKIQISHLPLLISTMPRDFLLSL